MHQKLFSQLELMGRELKNRVVAAVPFTFLAGNRGEAGERLVQYYERIAATDVAMVITEPAAVSHSLFFQRQLRGNENESVQGLARITERIRAHQALPILHLTHPGINAIPEKQSHLVYGPSAIEQPSIAAKIQELSYEQLRQIANNYLEAAISAWNAGFSGLEISGAEGSLIQQFLSPLTNHRKDDYGYQHEHGVKFALEIVKTIRKAVPDFILLFKIAGRDLIPAGKTLENSIFLAKKLEAAGINLLHVTSGFRLGRPDSEQPGGKSSPNAVFAGDSAIFKANLSLPILLSGKISDPDIAENILEKEIADAVSLGRTLNRDLDWLNKARMNSEIIKVRPCLRCLTCSAAFSGCPDMNDITLWDLNLKKFLKGK